MSTKIATEQQVKDVANTFTELYNLQSRKIDGLESGIIDSIHENSPTPIKNGMYSVMSPGVFLNFKDISGSPIEVLQEEYNSGFVFIVFNGNDNTKLLIPIEAKGEVKDGDVRAVSGAHVFNHTQTYNASPNREVLTLEEATNSVPMNVRKRMLIISYLSENGINLIQNLQGVPTGPDWYKKENWITISNPNRGVVINLEEKESITEIRRQVEYRDRSKGYIIKYNYKGFQYIEEILTDYKSDDFFLNDNNFMKLNQSTFINVSDTSFIPLTFSEAVEKVPLTLRTRGLIISYIDKDGVKNIQHRNGNPKIDEVWFDETNFVILNSSKYRGVLYLEEKESIIEIRKQVNLLNRWKGQLIQYSFKGETFIEEIQTNDKQDQYFLLNSNFRSLLSKVNDKVKLEITNSIKENKIIFNNDESRKIYGSRIGDIKSKEVVVDPLRSLVRVGLHYGAHNGDYNLSDEIYFNSECQRDFSDIRFRDEAGNILEHHIVSNLDGYDVSREYNAKMLNNALSDGRLVCSDYTIVDDRNGLFIKNSLVSEFEQIQVRKVLMLVSSKGIIFSRGSGSDLNKLYKMIPNEDGSYTPNTEYLVHTVTDGSFVQTLEEDSKGNLYCSKYQAEWDVEIFKSINDGDSFSTIYKTGLNQHVHHIYIDDRDWIFVGMDGFRYDYVTDGKNQPRCMLSKDFGATWEDINIPYENKDYGVTYSGIDLQGRRFYIGNGECSILGGYTLYKSFDLIKWFPVLQTKQGVRKVTEFRGLLLAGGNAGQNNRTAQIYLSKDKGENWESLHLENWIDTQGAGDGMRFFSNAFKYSDDNSIQRIIVNGYAENPGYYPVTITRNQNQSYAVCNVLTNKKSKIFVEYGYLIPYENPENTLIFENKGKDFISNYKFDEGAGFYVEEYVSNTLVPIVGDDFKWKREDIATFDIIAHNYSKSRNALGVSNGTYLVRNVNQSFANGFTIIFWINMEKYKMDDTNKYLIWGDPNGLHVILHGKREIVMQGSTQLMNRATKDVFRGQNTFTCHYISINNTANEAIYKVDGGYPIITTGVKPILSTPNTKEYIFGDGSREVSPYLISDLRVYNRAMTYNEMTCDFLGYDVPTKPESRFEHVNY